ncbi:MAG: 50S ribosomal protein L11 methyltransferase [Verrucomicrobiota bacterium]
MDYYFDCYGGLELQRFMVSDKPRTDAFAAAIEEVVEEGDRVLDLGTGTGLLALLSAKAGAKEVYAIDQATIAEVAKELIRQNGYDKTIDVINANATDFQLAEPVDILISEWLGHLAFVECMLDDVIDARDNNLKPGGLMMPSHVEVMLAPTDSRYLYDEQGPGFWQKKIHGIDYSCLEKLELNQALGVKTEIQSEDLLAPAQALVSLDLSTASKEDPWQSGNLQFTAPNDGRLDGFAAWFDAQLSPSVKLQTGPEHQPTHWSQFHFPFPPMRVEAGETIEVKYALNRHPHEKRSIELSLEVNGTRYDYTVG